MAASATERVRRKKAKEIAYKLTSRCHVCERPITPGQTWKFTLGGKKVHYYCAQQNPEPEYETMKSRLTQEGVAIARRLHPQEYGQPVSRYYILEKWKHVIPGYEWMSLREKREAEGYLISAYLREAKKLLAVGNPAGLTFVQAMTMARQAGAKIGDTSGFEPWLSKAGLDTRSPQVVAKLRQEFWSGVEHGGPASPSSPAAQGIWKDDEGWRVSIDPDSLFDSYQEAKRFVEAQARNPRRRIVDEVLEEHIRMPGMPGLIVTRGFALQWWEQQGWAGPKHGIGSLDHYVMLPKPLDEPLTDPELRDYNLEGMARSLAQANPNLSSRREFEALGYRLGQARGQQDRRSEELGVMRSLGLGDIRLQAQWHIDNQLVYQPGYSAKWSQAVSDKFVSGYYAGYSGRKQRRTA